MKKRSSRAGAARVVVPPIVVLGESTRVARQAALIAKVWPVHAVPRWDHVDVRSYAGVLSGVAGALGPIAAVPQAKLDEPDAALRVVAEVLGWHYTASQALATAVRDFAVHHQLSFAQAELLALFCTDLTRAEVCERLGISPNTMKSRVRTLCHATHGACATAEDLVRTVHRLAIYGDAAPRRTGMARPVVPTWETPRPRAPLDEAMAELRDALADRFFDVPLDTLMDAPRGLWKFAAKHGASTLRHLLTLELSSGRRHRLSRWFALLDAEPERAQTTHARPPPFVLFPETHHPRVRHG